jgi:hypothetical protein
VKKEDWIYNDQYFYKFRSTGYGVYVYRFASPFEYLGYFITLPDGRVSISDIFEDINVSDEDKIALSYYAGLEFEANYILSNDASLELLSILNEAKGT